jgi:hypothetical protein
MKAVQASSIAKAGSWKLVGGSGGSMDLHRRKWEGQPNASRVATSSTLRGSQKRLVSPALCTAGSWTGLSRHCEFRPDLGTDSGLTWAPIPLEPGR